MRPLLQPELYLNATFRHRLNIQFINYAMEPPSNLITYRLRLQSKDTIIFKQVIHSLAETEGLQEVNLQEGEVP